MSAASLGSYVGTVRDASGRLVRELGFMKGTLAGTGLPPSAVHALVEIGAHGALTGSALSEILILEKSSVSRIVRKLVVADLVHEGVSEADGRARPLALTDKGRATLAAIDDFANAQVVAACELLDPGRRSRVLAGLAGYAEALRACRTGERGSCDVGVTIENVYRPGVLGRTVEMHAHYYAHAAGFGRFFERKIAADLAGFLDRLDDPRNGLWVAVRDDAIIGTVAIDGQDFAHLRWFIVEDDYHGCGIGRALLTVALAFCDERNFREVHLWTFQGLDAARRLYEHHGFALVEERPGRQWGGEVVEQRFVRACRPPAAGRLKAN